MIEKPGDKSLGIETGIQELLGSLLSEGIEDALLGGEV